MDGLVLAAGGSSTRFGAGASKVFRRLGGKPLFLRALAPFQVAVENLAVVVVARAEDVPLVRSLAPGLAVVEGGASRQESVRRGLAALPKDVEVVLVHDAARPLCSADLVRRVLDAARRNGAAAAVFPVGDSLHRVEERTIRETIPRAGVVAAQTPQAARADLLRRALDEAAAAGLDGTDEASALVRAGVPVTAVRGERWNLKVTVPEDLEAAERLLGGGRRS